MSSYRTFTRRLGSSQIRLSYRRSQPEAARPNRPTLVFLHAFPLNQSIWDAQFEALGRDWDLLSLDFRGHGKSEVGSGQYLIEFFVDDLMECLEHLEIRQSILCGLSMGGYVALRAIEKYPSRVSGLLLCDTRSEPDTNEAKLKRAFQIELIGKRGLSAISEPFIKSVVAPETDERNPELVTRLREMIESTAPEGVIGALLALSARTDTTPSLAQIAVPTWVLVGEKDTLTPPSAAQALHSRIPRSELKIIPGAGHLISLEAPEKFNELLREYLKRFF